MVLKSKVKYTPELLVEAPVRSDAVPNDLGTHAVYTVSKYTIETHSSTKQVRVLNIETGKSKLFSDDEHVEEVKWLVGNLLLWKRKAAGGTTEIWVGNGVADEKDAYLVGKIEAAASLIETKLLPKGNIAFTFAALVSGDGELLNEEALKKPKDTAREWDTARVRFWSEYHTTYGSSLWYTTLEKKNNRWTFGKAPVDAFKNTGYLFPWEPANMSIGEGSGYKLSPNGILLITQDDINHDLAHDAINELIYIPFKEFTEDQPPEPILVQTEDFKYGGATSVDFSPDGKTAAVLRLRDNGNVESQNAHLYVFELKDPKKLKEVKILNESREEWDLTPRIIFFGESSSTVYILAEWRARVLLYSVSLTPSKDGKSYEPAVAKTLTHSGATVSAHALKRRAASTPFGILLNTNSLVDSSKYSIVYPDAGHETILSSATESGALLGISAAQVSEFSFKGALDRQVQSWIVRPSDFQPDKKYPCMYVIHGGPNGAWADAWSFRWNMALFAEQGYIIVTPNPTGSTGFGEPFASGVNGDWGGKPYEDLEKCWTYVEENLHYVDADRAVILGGSYGGYMMNWVAGHPLAKKFKALVNHDGIFSLPSMFSNDIPGWLRHTLGAQLWDDQKKWDEQDPARFTAGWSQPMLVIHSDKDYRCPIESGLASHTVCLMKGIESRFLNYPNETHFVLEKANSLHWNRTVIGWCNKYAGVKDGIKLEPPVSEVHLRGRNRFPLRPRRGF